MPIKNGDGNYLDHRYSYMFHKLSRKTDQMIRICRLSATSQYSFFKKMSDLRIYDDFPRNHSTGHNIPQGLNFREKQNLVTPIQLWLP